MDVLIGFGLLAVVVAISGYLFWPARKEEPSAKTVPPHRNQFVVAEEVGKEPNQSELVQFPPRTSALATPFEDFNQRLFILEEGSRNQWPEQLIENDFPTKIVGDIGWVRSEIKQRLRPGYPTILDTFGWWAEASSLLEMNPNASHPVIAAYLSLPVSKRPVVISKVFVESSRTTAQLELFRYQFQDYVFDRKFLSGNASQALKEIMSALTGASQDWWFFSPARLRKSLYDRENLEAQAFAEQIRRATHENRFAALWGLSDNDHEEKKATSGSAK